MSVALRRSSAGAVAQPRSETSKWLSRQWLWIPFILGGLLVVLFIQSFRPDWILFVNDTTLGQMNAAPNHLPGGFAGKWHSGVWAGIEGMPAVPNISTLLSMIFPPELYLRIYAPFTLLFVGFCAWVFFRQLKFSPAVCVLGGLATGLNMHFFSVACWGQGLWNIAAGMVFLALAALCTKSIPQFWARAVLAGLAVGMNLMEGQDVGAILCIYVGVFILCQIFISDTPGVKKAVTALGTEMLVVFFSALIAAHSITSLVGTQVVGVAGAAQDEQTKEERWNPATQWSLPKLETLRIISPGLFGYRMAGRITTPDKSSAYWGTVGQDPKIAVIKGGDSEQRAKAIESFNLPPQPRADLQSDDPQTRSRAVTELMARSSTIARYSGSGEYAGVLVSLLAVFAVVISWSRHGTTYSRSERRAIWFWTGAALFSLLAAWGRHAFFYRLLYQLPYVSTIRNPIKFMHPFHIAWVILAAYGMEALWRRYVQTGPQRTDPLPLHLQKWWPKVSGFDKKWTIASVVLIVATVAGVCFYTSWKPHLAAYLEQDGISSARRFGMADFSVAEARWFAFWLSVSAIVVVCVISGAWSGKNAKIAWIFLGVILIADLVRSDVPWIHYFNYKEEYASNDVVDILQDKPYEHRVTSRLSPRGLGSGIGTPIGQQYDYWQQNIFPYYRIQTLDFAQWPRIPQLDTAYMKTFALHGDDLLHCDMWPTERLWQLTNTRYILTSSGFLPILNSYTDPRHPFAAKMYLKVIPKPGVTAIEDVGDYTVVPEARGSYAMIEFPNTLPRAKLYSRWQSTTNDDEALKTLASHDFDPDQTVLVSQNTPVGQPPENSTMEAGDVSITDYQPKYVKLEAHAATPAVLLFNDRIDPSWSVRIDQKSAPLLRCNYLMRGVFLTPGDHTVEFRFHPPRTALYLSLCGWGVGILTSGYLIYTRIPAPAPSPAPAPIPPTSPNPPPKATATPQPATANQKKQKRKR